MGAAIVNASIGEVEPNDTRATATATGLVGFGQITVTDAFLGDGDQGVLDVDVYSLELVEGMPLPVSLVTALEASGFAVDGYLRLFDDDGAELLNNDDRAFDDYDPQLATLLFEGGTYYIGVSASGNAYYDNSVPGSGMPGSAGAYELTITTGPVTLPASPFEPNDEASMATPMGSASFTVTDEFIGDGDHGPRDVDIYLLNLTGSAKVDVEVRAEAIGSTLDPVVRMRTCADPIPEHPWADPCGLGSNDDTPGGSVNSLLSIGVPSATDVYIMVSGAGNRRYDPSTAGSGEVGSVGPYDLQVSVTYFDSPGVNEPNDSMTSATYVAVPARPPRIVELLGFVGDGPYALTRGDRDFYEFEVFDQSGFFTIEVTAVPGSDLDPLIVAYDQTGRRIASDDNDGGSSAARITLPVTCFAMHGQIWPNHVYVMVMGTQQRFPNDPFVPWPDEHRFEEFASGDGPGSTGAYQITFSAESGVDCVNEPDDTLDTATPTGIRDHGSYLCTGGVLGDSTCYEPWLDADLWSLDVVHAPAFVEARICADNEEAGVGIYDAQGTEMGRSSRDGDGRLGLILPRPGRYYVAVVDPYETPFDPTVPCSAEGYADFFDLMIQLSPGTHPIDSRNAGGPHESASDEGNVLFATRLDAPGDVIDAIDVTTGESLARFNAPEARVSQTGGLSYDGMDLFFVGSGRYPTLYQLDGANGEVLDDYILWQGSGYYSDAVMLEDELFLLDFYDRSIHVIDPVGAYFIRTLPVGSINAVTIGGGLAALAGPNRLYVADAFNSGAIYEVDPQYGAIGFTLPPPATRPSALAGLGDILLYVGDFMTDVAQVLTRDGTVVGTLMLPGPPESLAGEAAISTFGDFDDDGDVDLVDFRRFQRCFTGSENTGDGDEECAGCDRNGDGRRDLFDFAPWPAASTGP